MTPAVEALRAAGVTFDLLTYEHDPGAAAYGTEAAEALDLDPATVGKTLLAETGTGLAVAVVPVTSRLDLKALARALGVKRVTMADPAVAERRTGYVVGGISPFGQRHRSPTVVDQTMAGLERVHVSGGRRGLEIGLAAADLIAVLDATVAPLAAPA